jgi:NDP-sugar pyrophosphorylase family protein
MRYNLDIIIPCAGLGRRMKSYGPKALVKVGTETLLARQMRLLRNLYPRARFVLVAGFESERIRKAFSGRGVRVVVNPDWETTNVAKSLAVGLGVTPPGRPALVVYGDLVFREKALTGLSLNRSSVLVAETDGREQEVGVAVAGGQATNFAYGLPVRWAHVVLLASREKGMFRVLAAQPFRSKYFGYEVLNEVLDAGGTFAAVFKDADDFVEIDTSRDIALAGSIGA